MLHYKEICLLALSGQDAIKQTCCLSPVFSVALSDNSEVTVVDFP